MADGLTQGVRRVEEGMRVRAAVAADADGLWRVLEPVVRAGETYALPVDMSRDVVRVKSLRDLLRFDALSQRVVGTCARDERFSGCGT
jgi:hypothetical protein